MVMNILQVVEIVRGINMSKCKNKKCNKDSSDNLYKDDWKVLGINYSGLMRICKLILILCVFIISSIQWGYSGDLIWQCIWSLSLIKLVEFK